MDKLKELSLFFPAYNEEANLEATVEKAIPVLKKVAGRYEMVIVDDGSKDKTGEIADRMAKKYSFIRVIHNRPNRGYGGAMQTGWYSGRFEWIAFIDADGQFDFAEITKFIEKQRQTNADLVIGFYLKRAVGSMTILTSKVWELLVFLFFGLRVTDIDCGFKMVKRKVIETIPRLESERGPFITSELLIKAKQAGFKFAEVGVHHYPRKGGQATGRQLKIIFSGLLDLIRLRLKM
jgi:glycosyltransferase involved in cell wall biosynthesis